MPFHADKNEMTSSGLFYDSSHLTVFLGANCGGGTERKIAAVHFFLDKKFFNYILKLYFAFFIVFYCQKGTVK